MALKKKQFAECETTIFDQACTYKRSEYWQFRIWIPKENKYALKRLHTRSEAMAIDAPSLRSLDGIDENEQYAHLSQLLHIQNATRDKK